MNIIIVIINGVLLKVCFGLCFLDNRLILLFNPEIVVLSLFISFVISNNVFEN